MQAIREMAMSGRNFWAEKQGDGWIVREEGLPDETTTHASPDEAWAAANERAASCGGEAFLQDDNGALIDRQWHGALPRDTSPV
jgi:hypothetical protein